MKSRHCDDCANGSYPPALYSVFARIRLNCAKGHKPRFHVPSSDPRDTDWGYKRKCADFAPRKTK